MNDDPTNPFSRWETILNVAEDEPISNPNHRGVFQIEVVGNNIWVSIGNRTDGFALVKGDGSNCVEPWVGDGHCEITWTTVIEDGGGRPGDLVTQAFNQNPDFVAGSGATLGIFGNDLYVGPSESGFFGISFSEMMRVKDAHQPNPQWELLIGWPRKDWAPAGGQAPPEFHCPPESRGDMANSVADLTPSEQALWKTISLIATGETFSGLSLIPLDDDDEQAGDDDCFPTTGAGPGYGTSWDPGDPDPASTTLPYMIGPYQYFWRFAEFLAPLKAPQLYVGTLDLNLGPEIVAAARNFGFEVAADYLKPGFDLLRTADGETFEAVTRDAFGSGLNGADYGVRTLLQVPKLGLAVGAANFDGDLGTDIYIGTRSPYKVPPYADAGPDQFRRDANPQDPTRVVASLNAGKSHSSFDGGTPVSCDWFEGEATVGCDGDLTFFEGPVACDDDVEVQLKTIDDGNRNPEYAFTVKVTDERGLYACDTTLITASSNQSPVATLESSDPDDIFDDGQQQLPFTQNSGTNSTDSLDASQQDQGNDGEESYLVTGTCADLDSPLLYVCEFVPLDLGNTVSNQTLDCGGATTLPAAPPCTVTATITTLTAARIDEEFGTGISKPDMALVVEDENQRTRVRWESETLAP
jgi:hypothetical protein